MSTLLKSLVVLLTITLSAYAHAPSSMAPLHETAKPGKSKIDIYRTEDALYLGVEARVEINGERVAELWRGESFSADYDPGRYVITTDAWSTFGGEYKYVLSAEPDTEYLLEISPRGSWMKPVGLNEAAFKITLKKVTQNNLASSIGQPAKTKVASSISSSGRRYIKGPYAMNGSTHKYEYIFHAGRSDPIWDNTDDGTSEEKIRKIVLPEIMKFKADKGYVEYEIMSTKQYGYNCSVWHFTGLNECVRSYSVQFYENDGGKLNYSTTKPSVIKQNEKQASTLIARIQKDLNQLGYNAGVVDGNLGPKTQTAIKKFQSDADLVVDGLASRELLGQLELVITLSKKANISEPKLASSGSGFVVSNKNHVLTNYHVIKDCNAITESLNDSKNTASVLAKDEYNDLALLLTTEHVGDPVTFRNTGSVKLGEKVMIAGYPLPGLISSDLNVTTGIISALAGPGNDRRYLQVTAPIQSGNSGGPLVGQRGELSVL